jgi:hypothetical protein
MSTVFESVLSHLAARHHSSEELAKLFHADAIIDESISQVPSDLGLFFQWWPCEVTILHMVNSATEASVVFDYLHDGTGMPSRQSWHMVFVDNGISKLTIASESLNVLQSRRWMEKHDWIMADFGFTEFDPSRDSRELLKLADLALEKELGRPPEYKSSEVLINEDLLYFPIGWVGCAGFLVDRKTFEAHLLGSGLPVVTHVWAHYRGFAKGRTGDERRNDLVITSVHSMKATCDLLRNIFGGGTYFKETLRPGLDALPLRINDIDLYSYTDELRIAELRGWFRFEVTPPTTDE